VQESTGVANWASVSAGSWHNLAVRDDGTLWTWGRCNYGQLGYGTLLFSENPLQVQEGPEVAGSWTDISAGGWHSVGIAGDGVLYVWGDNTYGQLGIGEITDKHTPVEESTEAGNWESVSAGGKHTVAINGDGELWAFGDNTWGQLGYPTYGTPGIIPDQESTEAGDWESVATGFEYTVAIKDNGTLWSWGRNQYGQLGNDTTTNSNTPVQESTGVANWASAASGGWHTVAINDAGELYAWGRNDHRQLGDGTLDNSDTPIHVNTDMHWTAASAADNHTAAIAADGTLWSWGHNLYGQLGDGNTTDTPAGVTRVQEITNNTWLSVSVSDYHTAAIDTTGHLWAWGLNNHGQLGNDTTTNSDTPVQVGTAANWASVSTGDYHTVAINGDGVVYAWGYNNHGQLGDGTTIESHTPQLIGNGYTGISAGDFFTVAITTGSELYAWGDNDFGQVHDWVTAPTTLLP
jgi:hypothetical protein